MRVRTFALYLIGDRQAILDIAASRHSLWIGLLLVLSAGLARDYDGEDLRREPWHLLIPVGASLVASFGLFLFACGPLFFRKKGRPPFLSAYRAFLSLFWMTAPLAWLYAIPYERFLSPGSATFANLCTLALVATWRVALMTWVISVITKRNPLWAGTLVLAFADTVMLIAIAKLPTPILIISEMGGIRMTNSEVLILFTTRVLSFFGYLLAPVWWGGAIVALFVERPTWRVPRCPPRPGTAGIGMWLLAVLSLVVWIPILPRPQSEQRLRVQVEGDLKAGRLAEAVVLMSAHEQSDFPPYWEPPPRVGYGEQNPRLLDVLEAVVAQDSAPWVREVYVDKLLRQLEAEWAFQAYTTEEVTTLVRIVRQLPEGPAIAEECLRNASFWLHHGKVSGQDSDHVKALQELAAKKVGPDP